jgi:hypothetical protein
LLATIGRKTSPGDEVVNADPNRFLPPTRAGISMWLRAAKSIHMI